MAQSKWRKVKVKVNGKMVVRWTDGKSYRRSEPAKSGAGIISNAVQSAYRAAGGGRGPSAGWKAAASEQRKPRRSDGQLSPRPSKTQRAVAAANNTPTKTPLKTIPAKDRPKDMQAGKVYGDAGQPPAPTLPPRPQNTPARVPAKPTRAPQKK